MSFSYLGVKANFILFLGFAFFGLLIGLVTGLTSSPIASAVITALFGFAGGTLLLKFDSKPPKEQIKTGLVLFGFSVFCAFGILVGIYIKVNKLLNRSQIQVPNKKELPVSDSNFASGNEAYLRTHETNMIELMYRRGDITADSAVLLLLNLNEK